MASVDVSRIASNIGAMNALNSLQNINKQMSLHQTRLSTGKRINSASDDPAGLTIATKMLARSEGLKTALDNIGDAQNMLSVAESGMSKMNDILVQMRSKAEQAASDTLGASERAAIQTQLSAYAEQLQNIVDETKWNGVKLLDADTGAKQFQTGADQNEVTTWQMASKLDPFSMAIATDQSTATSGDIIQNAQYGDNVSAVVASNKFTDAPSLAIGGYSVKVLSKAAATDTGYVKMQSSLTGGLSTITATDANGSELKSGNWQLTLDDLQGTGGTTATASFKLKNLDDPTASIVSQTVTFDPTTTVSDAAIGTTGIQMDLSKDMVIGSAVSFEYIGESTAKVEVDDASGQAIQISKNGSDWDSPAKSSYVKLNTSGTTSWNSGRGLNVTFAAFSSLDTTSVASFDFLGTGKYTVDVSNAKKASDYMGKVNTAIDSVTSALADIGALGARLSFKEDSVSSAQVNVEASYNRIMNANMAQEQVEASKYTILQQTATAMLSQANQAPQYLLSLFR